MPVTADEQQCLRAGIFCARPARTFYFQSVRGLPQSKTWRNFPAARPVATASWTAVVFYRFAIARAHPQRIDEHRQAPLAKNSSFVHSVPPGLACLRY